MVCYAVVSDARMFSSVRENLIFLYPLADALADSVAFGQDGDEIAAKCRPKHSKHSRRFSIIPRYSYIRFDDIVGKNIVAFGLME